ncbi:hypothetical protein JYP51_06310 [Ponticoccus gilvus]|nr:hypothetical protein [Enemella evansiae]
MNGPIEREAREKELLEYLRVYMIAWQKIDFIWGMFITSYIPLFGFLHFYAQEMGVVFAGLFIVAIAGFTWVNGSALRQHYDIVTTMSREYRRLNRSFPDLNAALTRTALDGRARMVLFTHGFAFAGFLYLMGEKVGHSLCGAASGWTCLWALVTG